MGSGGHGHVMGGCVSPLFPPCFVGGGVTALMRGDGFRVCSQKENLCTGSAKIFSSPQGCARIGA